MLLLLALKSATHIREKFFCLERLGQKGERSQTSRFHRHLHRAHASEHDDFGVGPAFLDEGQQFETRSVAQLLIENDDIGLRIVSERFFQRITALDFRHLIFALQHSGDQVADVRFVINK